MSNGTETKASLARRDFLAAATVAGLGAVTGAPVQAANQTVSARSASRVLGANEKKPVVGVYYYPWYRAPSAASAPAVGWMRKALRGRLEPKQLPKRGVYNSRDAETIADHIAQSKRGGVDFWAVSWWGPNQSTDTVFKDHILPHANAGKLTIPLAIPK